MNSLTITCPKKVQLAAPTRLPLRRLPIVAFKNEPRDQLTSQSTDIGRYLSTALVNIFRPTHTAKDVKFMVQPFTGRVSHSDKARIGTLYNTLRDMVRMSEGAISHSSASDVHAAASTAADATENAELKAYLEEAIERVFGHNFVGDKTEPDWIVSPFSGKIESQRDIQKLVAFEKVMKHAMLRVDEIAGEEVRSKKGLHRDM